MTNHNNRAREQFDAKTATPARLAEVARGMLDDAVSNMSAANAVGNQIQLVIGTPDGQRQAQQMVMQQQLLTVSSNTQAMIGIGLLLAAQAPVITSVLRPGERASDV
jgi:hypothetical protein